MNKEPSIALCIVTSRGFEILKVISSKYKVSKVITYRKLGILDDCFDLIANYCSDQKIPCIATNSIDSELLANEDLVFVAGGWQYLIHGLDDKLVILHDSLLPKYRGFIPTVSSLIVGESELGVTACKAVDFADSGDIYCQQKIAISYPLKIVDAYRLLIPAYVSSIETVIQQWSRASLKAIAQNHDEATYSIWRDEEDYWIDWTQDAASIERFVNAVGYPYSGAKTIYDNNIIRVNSVKTESDRNYVIRQPGKICEITNNQALVICNRGLIRIINASTADGNELKFRKMKCRLQNNRVAF